MSGILELFPEIDLNSADLGIFGKIVREPEKQEVLEGDRVEIYRPLLIDPKQARLNRAAKK
jgi:putative ubiquitin-RnfH superfamily antitoxin RatB of RatAB toxin-antitoxin module